MIQSFFHHIAPLVLLMESEPQGGQMTQELFTPEKVRRHELEDAKPLTKFLYAWCGQYHIGVRRELRYDKSGLIMRAYYVCKCNGRALNSYATEHDELPKYRVHRCKRCFGKEQGGYK